MQQLDKTKQQQGTRQACHAAPAPTLTKLRGKYNHHVAGGGIGNSNYTMALAFQTEAAYSEEQQSQAPAPLERAFSSGHPARPLTGSCNAAEVTGSRGNRSPAPQASASRSMRYVQPAMGHGPPLKPGHWDTTTAAYCWRACAPDVVAGPAAGEQRGVTKTENCLRCARADLAGA